MRLAIAILVSLPHFASAGESAPQWRAIWVDAFNPGIKTPAQVDKLVADAKSLHLNTLIVQVRKRGDALFRKSIEPFADDASIPAGFDPLADLLDKAHKADLQVHAWVNVGTLWPPNAPPPKSPGHIYHKHGPGAIGRDLWLTQDEHGQIKFETGSFLDSGHPDYQEHLTRVVLDLVKNYPVDGIHFDYVRYTESEGDATRGYGVGYNPTNVERFNHVQNRGGLPDRADPVWSDWRRQQVTQLVRRIRAALLELKPDVLLSAALIPWGDGPDLNEAGWTRTAPYNRAFQDWHAWRREGLLDLTVPMNYDREANPAHKAYFDHWINFERAYRYRSKLIVGVGSYLNSIPDNLNQVRRALAPVSDAGSPDGICIYNYAHFNGGRSGKTLDDLRRSLVENGGPFAKPVARPIVARIAQPREGTIAGRALAADGKPIDSKPVRIEPLGGGGAITALTDGNGRFAAIFVKPGKYRVTLDGRSTAVEVNAGKVSRADLKLP